MKLQLLGYDIKITPDIPGYTLRQDLPISAEERAITEAWILKTFTSKNVLQDGAIIFSPVQNTFLMNPRTYENLKARLRTMNTAERNSFMLSYLGGA